MNKTRENKRTLMTSAIVLLLCIVALIGATAAWFTSTASNTGNRIQAGTLKVDLLMDKTAAAGGAAGDYVVISNGTGDIFKEAAVAENSNITLWEPGKTQVVYLAVKNSGSLALKYNIIVDVADEGLVGSLEYAILNAKSDDATMGVAKLSGKKWSDITAAAGTSNTGDVAAGRTVAAEGGVMDEGAGETQYFALAVHMKETAGNEYQGKDAIIDVSVVATQLASEYDGFGTNTYDAQADIVLPTEPVHAKVTTTTAVKSTTTGDINFTTSGVVQSAIVNGSALAALVDVDTATTSYSAVFNLNVDTILLASTSTTYEITLDKVLTTTTTAGSTTATSKVTKTLRKWLTPTIDVGPGLKDVSVTHSGQPMTALASTSADPSVDAGGYYYDSTTGILTIKAKSFSPFKVSFSIDAEIAVSEPGETTKYMSLAAFRDSVNAGDTYAGKTATLLKNITLSGEWTSISATGKYDQAFAGTFDGANHVVSNMTTTDKDMNGSFFGSVTGTIKNLVLKDATVTNGRGVLATLGARSVQILNCSLQNCKVITDKSTGLLLGYVDEVDDALIKNCTTDSQSSVSSTGGAQAGGIVGQVCSGTGAKKITIENCTNNASVSGSNSVGGIVGQLGSGVETAVLKNCINNGTVTLTATGNAKYAGGIIGYRNCGGTSSGATTIDSCTNAGAVTSTLTGASVGGMMGYSNGVSVSFISCQFASSASAQAEGAANTAGYIAWYNGGTLTLDACTSEGTIGDATNKGYYWGTGNGSTTINTNCTPTGNTIS